MDAAEESRKAASVVGLAGLLWAGLGVVNSLQYAWNSAWQVPGRGIRDRAVGLGWLAGAGLLFVGSFVLSAVSQWLPWYLAPLGVAAGFATGVTLWLWTAHTLPNRKVGWRPLLPAAVVGAIGFEVLKLIASVVVPRVVASSSALYGPLGVVFALLAWLLVFGRLVVYAAVIEVVLWEERHGTVELTLEVPARPGLAAVGATRAGEQRLLRPKRARSSRRRAGQLKPERPSVEGVEQVGDRLHQTASDVAHDLGNGLGYGNGSRVRRFRRANGDGRRGGGGDA